MAMLSLTGGIYLFKQQIEAWLYADQMNVAVTGAPVSYEAQIAAVEADLGVTRLRGVIEHGDLTRSTMIEFDDAEGRSILCLGQSLYRRGSGGRGARRDADAGVT